MKINRCWQRVARNQIKTMTRLDVEHHFYRPDVAPERRRGEVSGIAAIKIIITCSEKPARVKQW